MSDEEAALQSETGRTILSNVREFFFRDCMEYDGMSYGLICHKFGNPSVEQVGNEFLRYIFPQGFELDAADSTEGEGIQLEDRVYLSPECALPINEAGIRPGSTRDEVLAVNGDVINTYQTTAEMIVIGAFATHHEDVKGFYDIGVYFVMKNDVVISIYFGRYMGSPPYNAGFYPDREVGIPLTAQAINEQASGEPGLFYLGQLKADVMLILADYNVAWRAVPEEDCCVVIGDEFIFKFDDSNMLISVAADGGITQRGCVRITSLGLDIWHSILLAFWKYGEKYDVQYELTDDYLGTQAYKYTKYTFDMGTYKFFVCSVLNNHGSELSIRWGIETNEAYALERGA